MQPNNTSLLCTGHWFVNLIPRLLREEIHLNITAVASVSRRVDPLMSVAYVARVRGSSRAYLPICLSLPYRHDAVEAW